MGGSFDYIYVKEDSNLRGRRPLEVANLLYRGALWGGEPDKSIELIPDEAEATRKALEHAQSGDVIVVFFEKMDPLIQTIKEYERAPMLS